MTNLSGKYLTVFRKINDTHYDNGTSCLVNISILNVWADAIQEHYLKVICAIGLPGNLAAILTITTTGSLSTAAILMALLAASDSAALVVKLVMNQLYSLDTLSDHYCRSNPLANVCSTYANWLLVIISAERMVAVTFPVVRDRLLSKSRVCGICVLVVLPIFGLNAPLIAGSIAVSGKCFVTDEVSYYANHAWIWLNILFYALLPIVALLGINAATCASLWKASRRRRTLMGSYINAAASREVRRCEWAFTAMVLAASLFFVLLVLPQCFYFILFEYTEVYASSKLNPGSKLMRQVTTLLADSTHALNFYLYVISVRRFRRQFVACVCSRRWRRIFRSLSLGSSSSRLVQRNGAREVGSVPLDHISSPPTRLLSDTASSDQTATSLDQKTSCSEQTTSGADQTTLTTDPATTSMNLTTKTTLSSDQSRAVTRQLCV